MFASNLASSAGCCAVRGPAVKPPRFLSCNWRATEGRADWKETAPSGPEFEHRFPCGTPDNHEDGCRGEVYNVRANIGSFCANRAKGIDGDRFKRVRAVPRHVHSASYAWQF